MMEIIFLGTPESRNIIDELLNDNPVMLAGSGISVFKPISRGGEKVDTGLPTGKKFNDSMYSYLFPSDLLYKDTVFSLREQWKKVAFENLVESCPDEVKLRRIIKKTFEEMNPNLIHQYLAEFFIEKKISGIITPNYDTCLDNLLKAFNVKPVVVKGDLERINLLDNNVYFKIHGSVDADIDGENLIFALHHEGLLKPWKRELLDKMVRDRSLLIVGYSGLDFDICPLLLEIPLKNIFWYVRGENVDEVMNKLSPNALEFLEQKNGYFIVGKMKDLFSHIKYNSSLLTEEDELINLEEGDSDKLFKEIKQAFTETEKNIWKMSILNTMGCASLASKMNYELMKLPRTPNQEKKIKLQFARSLYDLGKYKEAAKEYELVLKNHNLNTSEKITVLKEISNCYKVYGSPQLVYINKKIKSVCGNDKKCNAWNTIRYLRLLYLIVDFLHFPLKNYIRKKAGSSYLDAGSDSIGRGDYMEWQQCRHWMERMEIDPYIIKEIVPYAPPSNQHGYNHIASSVGQSMFIRDLLLKTHNPIPENIKNEFKEVMKRNLLFGLYPELWKLCIIDLRRNMCDDKRITRRLAFRSYRKCEYSAIMKILSLFHAYFHLFRPKCK